MIPNGTDQPPRPKDGWTVECPVRFQTGRNGRRRLQTSDTPEPAAPLAVGRVPRAARLLALAHRFEGLLRSGVIRNHTELARLAGVSGPRVTQVLNLLHLAPAIQEVILHFPLTFKGRDPISEPDLRPIARVPDWPKQIRLWNELLARASLAIGRPMAGASNSEGRGTETVSGGR